MDNKNLIVIFLIIVIAVVAVAVAIHFDVGKENVEIIISDMWTTSKRQKEPSLYFK